MRENDRHWMDAGCDGWDTKNKEPMKDIHLERYMRLTLLSPNETTLIECLADEGKEWKDRDQDEWCCEKCWKTETVIRKRNIYLFGNKAMWVGEGVGREDYLASYIRSRKREHY